ncbi:unnamed protein product [Sphacelaria rigidula]
MVNVNRKRCGKEGCFKHRSYGVAGGSKAEFCTTHARAGMVNFKSKRCRKEGCFKDSSYGVAGGEKAEFCATHARAGMVNFENKRCDKDGCSTSPTFGAAGGRKAELCARHVRISKFNVTDGRLGKEGSTKLSFGEVGDLKVEFRFQHACTEVPSTNSSKYSSQRRPQQTLNQANCRDQDPAHGLAVASDEAGRIKEGDCLNDDFVGEDGGGIHGRGEELRRWSAAGPDKSDGSRSIGSRHSAHAGLYRRRREDSTITPLAVPGQPTNAAADEECVDTAETRTKVEMEICLPPARDSKGMSTSEELVAMQSTRCRNMCSGNSSGTESRSSGSITSGTRKTKLLRRVTTESEVDMETGSDVMARKEANLKLELG